ncbi:MAG: hypothetical protein LQ351_004849 [Letrouitia transgressa]|nr:MAG: hypothetical protein LQ351_004849 [Letrouitia transgressa]
MEAVGVAISVASLAGLFTSCLECLNLVEASRSFAREDSLLCTNFEVQKIRLLIWGESVGFPAYVAAASPVTAEGNSNGGGGHTSDNSVLSKKWVRAVVHQILLEVQLLFDDTESLRSRYGLQLAKDGSAGKSIPFTEGGLVQSFKQRLGAFQLSLNRNQKEIGFSKKLRWVVSDRKRFANLVEQLRQLINGLQDITPDLRRPYERKVKNSICGLSDILDLRMIRDACAQSDIFWSETASECIEGTQMSNQRHNNVKEWLDKAEEGDFSDQGSVDNSVKRDAIPQAADSKTPKSYFLPMPYVDIGSKEIQPLFKACKDPRLLLFHGLPFDVSHPSHSGLIYIYCDVSWCNLVTAMLLGRGIARYNYIIRIDDRLSSHGTTRRNLVKLMEEKLEILEDEPKWLAKPLGISRSELAVDLKWLEYRIESLNTRGPQSPDAAAAEADFEPFMACPDSNSPEATYVVASPSICSQMNIAPPDDTPESLVRQKVIIPQFMHSFTVAVSDLFTVHPIARYTPFARDQDRNRKRRRWGLHLSGCLLSLDRARWIEFTTEKLQEATEDKEPCKDKYESSSSSSSSKQIDSDPEETGSVGTRASQKFMRTQVAAFFDSLI